MTTKLRIRFIGDHSNYHCGCVAVVQSLTKQLLSAGQLTYTDDYDFLVVNGEGTMHHSTRACIEKLRWLERAVSGSKKASLINTVWQENTNEFDSILGKLSGVTVREALSGNQLLHKHNIRSVVRLDASYWADIDETSPSVDYNNSIVVGGFFSKIHRRFSKIDDPELNEKPFVSMRQNSWSSLVKSLRTASLFVTGRHHGVYAACRAGIPFISLTSNTHKIDGLIEMSGLPIPICKTPEEIKDAIIWSKRNSDIYFELFDWMERQPKLCPMDFGLE